MAQEHVTPAPTALTFIDFFCGCGGFSLGLTRAGLRCLATIDFNPRVFVMENVLGLQSSAKADLHSSSIS